MRVLILVDQENERIKKMWGRRKESSKHNRIPTDQKIYRSAAPSLNRSHRGCCNTPNGITY